MGFKQYKQSNFVTYHDLPNPAGAVATISKAEQQEHENFRTKEQEMKVVLYFGEFKPLICTNTNLDTLEICYPKDDLSTIVGKRVWLMPTELMVAGDMKQIVRIDQTQTLRMQPDPSQVAAQDSHGQGAPAGESRDDDVPLAGEQFPEERF